MVWCAWIVLNPSPISCRFPAGLSDSGDTLGCGRSCALGVAVEMWDEIVNPYVAFALVMCGVVLIALVATAYMAVYFTRRAKADLTAALTPLAGLLENGAANIEDAEVTGRYHQKLSFGRMANAEGGPVRVFQTEMIDACGGESWMQVAYPAKGTIDHRPEQSGVIPHLIQLNREDLPEVLGVSADWYQLEYSADGGYVRLTVPMATRKDIPTPANFNRQLEALDTLSDENRAVQAGGV